MRFLLSNDDGVLAPGIRCMADALRQENWIEGPIEIDVIAPDRNRSGASNSLTLTRPLRVKWLEERVGAVEGTPTDCVHLAVTGLLDELPDIIISGINEGSNMGDDVLYSGTVAAATEGRYLGLPAIAVSIDSHDPKHYETAASVVKRIVLQLTQDPLPSDTILNINVPDIPESELQGYEVTRLGTRHKAEPTIVKTDPRGKTVYWIGLAGPEQDAGVGTDFYAVKQKKVSITPLKIDFTKYTVFDQLASWVEKLPH